MKKPMLEDFELSDELLKEYEVQQKKSIEKMENYLEERKESRKMMAMVTVVVNVLAVLILILLDLPDLIGPVVGLCLVWDVVFGLHYYQSTGETSWNIRYDKRKEIQDSVINKNLEKAIMNYKQALADYKKATAINELSLVKAEMIVTSFFNAEEKSVLSEVWIVFSNIYLANPRSFPDIIIPNWDDPEFAEYYEKLVRKQMSIKPKPKKQFNLDKELYFYYPCTTLFVAFYGKTVEDVVDVGLGVSYRILEVINPNLDY